MSSEVRLVKLGIPKPMVCDRNNNNTTQSSSSASNSDRDERGMSSFHNQMQHDYGHSPPPATPPEGDDLVAALEVLNRENERMLAELAAQQELLDLFEQYREAIEQHLTKCTCQHDRTAALTVLQALEEQYQSLMPIRVSKPPPASTFTNTNKATAIPIKVEFKNNSFEIKTLPESVASRSSPTSTTMSDSQRASVVSKSGRGGYMSTTPILTAVTIGGDAGGGSSVQKQSQASMKLLESRDVTLTAVRHSSGGSSKSKVRAFLDSLSPNEMVSAERSSMVCSPPPPGSSGGFRETPNGLVYYPPMARLSQHRNTNGSGTIFLNQKGKILIKQGKRDHDRVALPQAIAPMVKRIRASTDFVDHETERLDRLNNALDQILQGRYEALNNLNKNGEDDYGEEDDQDGDDEDDEEEEDDDDDDDDHEVVFLNSGDRAQVSNCGAKTILSAALESGYKPYPDFISAKPPTKNEDRSTTIHRVNSTPQQGKFKLFLSNSNGAPISASSMTVNENGKAIELKTEVSQLVTPVNSLSATPFMPKRPHLTRDERMDIIDRLKRNECGARIARDYGITKQAVSAIKRRAQLMGCNFDDYSSNYYVSLSNNTFAPLSSQVLLSQQSPSSNSAGTKTRTTNNNNRSLVVPTEPVVPPQQTTTETKHKIAERKLTNDNSLVARQLKQQKLNDTILKQGKLLAQLPRAQDLVLPVNPVAIIKSQLAKQQAKPKEDEKPELPTTVVVSSINGLKTNTNCKLLTTIASASPTSTTRAPLILSNLLKGTSSYVPTLYNSSQKGSNNIKINIRRINLQPGGGDAGTASCEQAATSSHTNPTNGLKPRVLRIVKSGTGGAAGTILFRQRETTNNNAAIVVQEHSQLDNHTAPEKQSIQVKLKHGKLIFSPAGRNQDDSLTPKQEEEEQLLATPGADQIDPEIANEDEATSQLIGDDAFFDEIINADDEDDDEAEEEEEDRDQQDVQLDENIDQGIHFHGMDEAQAETGIDEEEEFINTYNQQELIDLQLEEGELDASN